MDEIIQVRLEEKLPKGIWVWTGLLGSERNGRCRLPMFGLRVGDKLVVEIRTGSKQPSIVRVVKAPDHATAIKREHDIDPFEVGQQTKVAPLQPGDIVIARIRFSRNDGSGRTSKRRPCAIIEICDDDLFVRPIYSSDTSLNKTGGARRLKKWKEAGIQKPSVVSAEVVVVPRDVRPPRVGALVEDDKAWVLTSRSSRQL